jgi:transmembrane protein EpsG
MLRNIFLFVVIIILLAISGLRKNIGDTEMYIHLYRLIGQGYVSNGGYEPGFITFYEVLNKISKDPQFMLLVTSAIINYANVWTLKSFAGYIELNTFMYIASGYYLVTMNGLRQSLVAAILFSCSNFIINGKLKSYVIVVIIMSTIHSSALVLIPVYFLVRSEAWSAKVYIFILIFIVSLFIYDPLMSLVFGVLGDTRFGDYKNFKEGGANFIRVAVYAVPVILAYIKRDRIRLGWPESNVIVNMSLLNLIIMCFSLNNWIFARFTVYFQIYNFVLLSYVINYCTKRSERRLLYVSLVAAHLVFFWYEQSISLNIQYRTNFKLI